MIVHSAWRTRAATSVLSEPNVFYVGQVDGGIWKADDYGSTWNPIFDGQPSQSIGAIAVPPLNSSTVYVSSGEALYRPDLSFGDAISRSANTGKTWQYLGKLVRRFASTDAPYPTPNELAKQLIPLYRLKMPETLPATAGMHHWEWDLRATTPTATSYEYPISAVPHRTPRTP